MGQEPPVRVDAGSLFLIGESMLKRDHLRQDLRCHVAQASLGHLQDEAMHFDLGLLAVMPSDEGIGTQFFDRFIQFFDGGRPWIASR